MSYLFGVLAGIAWGGAVGLLNAKLTKAFIAKNNANLLAVANLLKTIIDAAALGLVFLLRELLPFDAVTCMVATAISVSLITIASSYYLASKMK